MSTTRSRGEPHASWSNVLDLLAEDSAVRPIILESWERCRAAGIDRGNAPLQRVADADLAHRLVQNAELVAATRQYIDWVSALIAETPHVVYLTDSDGVVLLTAGNDPELMRAAGLEPGFIWSERLMGTNGAGTALATGQPQAVVGTEHYVEAFGGCTCTAAPVLGPDGRVLGAIDISTSNMERIAERMLLVTHAARIVQRDLEAWRTAALAERRAAEAENARQTLEALLEHIPEGITIAGAPDVRILRVSRHGERLTGRSHDQLAIAATDAAHATAWGICWPDGTPARDEELPLTRAVRNGEVSTGEEWLLLRPDGTSITILTNAGPIRDAEGTVTGGVIAWRDVSELKAAERHLRRNEAHVRELYEAAERAVRQREEVMAIVSHDLRNPLNAILAGASLLSDYELPEDKKARQVSMIARAARKMTRLIEDLLDATRMQTGSFRILADTFAPTLLIEEAISGLVPLIEDKALQLRTEVDDGVPAIEADRARLLQVLDNLLGNAIRHSPDRGRIDVRLETRGDEVLFTVADEGPGIAEVDRPHLFEKFWQGQGRATGGAGLGLAICKGIVEAHGGRIWLDDTAPTGTVMRFTVPLRPPVGDEPVPSGGADAGD